MKEKVRAVPFLLKATIMALKRFLSMKFYSTEEKKEPHNSITKQKNNKAHFK